MKICLFLSICLCSFLTGTSQIDNFVKNDIQNKAWLDVLKKLDLDSQLYAIRERISFDTAINLSAPLSISYCRSGLSSADMEKIKLRHHEYDSVNLTAFPLWVIIPGQNITMTFSKEISSEKFKAALSLLDTKHISEVTFLPEPAYLALYGSEGVGGVIFLHVRNKKIQRKFKKLTKRT